MTLDLFAEVTVPRLREPLAEGAQVLRGFVTDAEALLADIRHIESKAPFRHLVTPGGFRMSVAMTNCGALGWVSDRRGYRYDAHDPETGAPWPPMPASFALLARAAAAETGFAEFVPDVCLINRYVPGARLTLHQDRNERGLDAPIVSVSLGLPAMFLFGGLDRRDRTARVPLFHRDVVVWGGASRMRFHGVLALAPGQHPLLGECRINLTFRIAA